MSPPRPAPAPSRRVVGEVAALVTLAMIVLFVAEAIGRLGGVFQENQGALTAIFFLVAPWIVLRRRGLDPAAFGLHGDRPVRAVLAALAAGAVVFPPYVLGFGAWVGLLDHAVADWSRLPAPSWWAWWFFVHLVVVALPEEAFFRGYVQGRLAPLFRRRIQVLGVALGPEVVLASALFALVHLVAIPAPFRLAVFFPGLLFGWLRQRTGSVLAPALLHAASNVVLAALNTVYG